MISSDPRVQAAIHSVRRAGILVRQIEQELNCSAWIKDDRSPVTISDYASQVVVAYTLTADLGNITLVAEEDAHRLRQQENRRALDDVVSFAGRVIPGIKAMEACDYVECGSQQPSYAFWTLDPIDGTKGFLRGDHYAVALAYIEGGQVMIAVLACPKLDKLSGREFPPGQGTLLVAKRGEGAWVGPLDIRGSNEDSDSLSGLKVSSVEDPRMARILRSVEAAHTSESDIDRFAAVLATRAPAVALDSQAKYAVLAGGDAELLVRFLSANRPHYREKIWDQASGSLVVEEAGGCVTDLDGARLDFSQGRALEKNRGVLVTNGLLHASALAAIREIGA